MLQCAPRASLWILFLSIFICSSSLAEEASRDREAALLSLPYVQYVKEEKAPSKVGVTIHKKAQVFPGYTVYTSDMAPDGFVNLIDMDGRVLHTWANKRPRSRLLRWEQVTPFSDGSVFLSCQMGTVDWQLVDAKSRIIATYDIPGQWAHHAAYPLNDGGFLGIVQNQISISFEGEVLKVADNSLVHVSSVGQVLKRISLNKVFTADGRYRKNFETARERAKGYKYFLQNASADKNHIVYDPLHTNNIVILEKDIPGVAKKGAWLVTVRNLDRVVIIDPDAGKILWQWGGDILSFPHHATVLNGDQILLFDNGVNKGASRVIVLDIKSKKILWQYGQIPGQKFFSATRGSAQRLPNGNTLIVESDKGRAFEVTLSGEIVWEWYAGFYDQGAQKGKRRVVSRAQRIPYDFFKGVEFNYGKVEPSEKKRKKK